MPFTSFGYALAAAMYPHCINFENFSTYTRSFRRLSAHSRQSWSTDGGMLYHGRSRLAGHGYHL